MEFQIFRLVWMLFIHRIYTKPHFTISEVRPKHIIKFCQFNGAYDFPDPTFTILASLSGITSYEIVNGYHPKIRVHIDSDPGSGCIIDIDDRDDSRCPGRTSHFEIESHYVSCYCYKRINDQYYFNITREVSEEDAIPNSMLTMELLRLPTSSPVEYKTPLPVTLEVLTCFGAKGGDLGVKVTEAGDIWNAKATLTITDADNSRYQSVVKFKEDALPFCEIDIRNDCEYMFFHKPPNGDRICWCEAKYHDDKRNYCLYVLNVQATAKASQSQHSLTAELLSSIRGPALTGTIGTLPTIIEQTTRTLPTTTTTTTTTIEQSTTKSQGTTTEEETTEEETTKEETTEEETTEASPSNVWLILILSGLERFCFSVVLWYFTNKYRKRTGTSEDGCLQTKTLKNEQANCETVSDFTARPKRMKGKTSGSAVFIDSDTCQHSKSQSVSDNQTTSTSSVKK